ncbi:2TM domain-containing protein [Anthocerotibacter panamensis]|uniref:2TM domain-containing protein n=1 Tax=Anthocerotibacter panamensis TaxID=2857077 RepID=UPI001C4063F9|nr:2TM domain-containing protein [Anthocerotibacter panamensis]
MPPKLSSPPDPNNPEYQQLRDRINFALHVAFFLCLNSGLLFLSQLWQTPWPWRVWLMGLWFALLVGHALYVFRFARYGPS